jgi:large subunit ribosomal protein L17
MRHRKAGRKLGRNPAHRLALLRNLANALFTHERIVTTVSKAKALRPFAERLITLAKRGTLHARRLVIARLGKKPLATDKPKYRSVVEKLFKEIGPRYKDRPGGYTRILKLSQFRVNDGAPLAIIELVHESVEESREKNRRKHAKRGAEAPTGVPSKG